MLLLFTGLQAVQSVQYARALRLAVEAIQKQQVSVASAYFNEAVQILPQNVTARRNAAQIAFDEGRLSQAIELLEVSALATNDWESMYLLARAYDADQVYEKADPLWDQLGYSVIGRLVASGETFIRSENYDFAYAAYRRAAILDNQQNYSIVHRAVTLSVLAHVSEVRDWIARSQRDWPQFLVYSGGEKIVVPGKSLQRFRPSVFAGENLMVNDTPYAHFNYVAGEAVAVVEVTQGGRYHVSANTVAGGTGPVYLSIEVNRRSIADFTLQQGTERWPMWREEVTVELVPGIYLVGVRFHDYPLDSSDSTTFRYAGVENVTLEKAE